MLETQTQEKEFVNGNIPLVSVSVEDKVASVFLQGWQNENDTSGLFSQDEIREFISLLLEVHDYMEEELIEENQMKLFDEENLDDTIETEEIVYDVAIEPSSTHRNGDFSDIVNNSTAFLYMMEDYTKEIISTDEVEKALHILRDSIESYLTDIHEKTDGQEEEQQEDHQPEPTEE